MGLQRLTREAIEGLKSIDDRPFEDVEIPEWGMVVRVQSMSAGQSDRMEAAQADLKKAGKGAMDDFRARLAVATCVDEKGVPLFSEEDVAWLTTKSRSALNRIFDVATRLNGLRAVDVEELTKNSGSEPAAD